jgi:hypothetical protein
LHAGGVVFLRFKRIKTALQQGISLFKDPSNFLTCPLLALAVALARRATPTSRMFPQFAGKKNSAAAPETIRQLSHVELKPMVNRCRQSKLQHRHADRLLLEHTRTSTDC